MPILHADLHALTFHCTILYEGHTDYYLNIAI